MNDAFEATGIPSLVVADLTRAGIDPHQPAVLLPLTFVRGALVGLYAADFALCISSTIGR